MGDATELTCGCGQVALRVQGKPILTVECLCSDCQSAGQVLQARENAPTILDANGATPFVMYRKDRVQLLRGADQLREYRLTGKSSTRRVVAACCNTPIFAEFAAGHWLSIYAGLWPSGTRPPLDLRTMTRSAPAHAVLPDDVPNPRTHTVGFYARLLGAWVAMGFRAPRIDYVKGSLDGS